MMTCCLPNSSGEINNVHAKIYGVNTLGAFLGCLLGGFWLLPSFGLPFSLLYAGGANILVSFIYMANRLEGAVEKPQPSPPVKNPFSDRQIYLLVFCSGLVSISLEIIWFRLWGLTIGNSSLVFPMVLSLFVLGLGYGSLTIKDMSYRGFKRQVVIFLVMTTLSYAVVTLMPQWTYRIRTLFVSMPHAYIPFYIATYLLLAAVLLPFVIPLGRILPMGYAFLKKGEHNYGHRCGVLYFINTSGTFGGAVVVSYFLLYFFNIDHVYLLNFFIFIAIYAVFVVRRERTKVQFAQLAVLVVVVFLCGWQRDIHVLGNFRERVYSPSVAGSFLSSKKMLSRNKVLALSDGPNTTVGVMESRGNEGAVSLSIMVNGKSDSSSHKDFGTTSLLALIPYLAHYSPGEKLRASVVGLGTGVTVGVLGQFEGVGEVDALEISSEVVKMNHFFDPYNYRALKNPKVTAHVIDAFKFYVKNSKKYHLIISEPTNPWVVGVENLYTPYFYKIAKNSLTPSGVFVQWIHTYSISEEVIKTIVKNMNATFPFIRIYATANGDLLALGKVSSAPELALGGEVLDSPDGPFIRALLNKNGIPRLELLSYLEVLSPRDVVFSANLGSGFFHDIFNPTLSLRALKPFFVGQRVATENLSLPFYTRLVGNPSRFPFLKMMSSHMNRNPSYCKQRINALIRSQLCSIYKKDLDHYNSFRRKKGKGKFKLSHLGLYRALRNRSLMGRDEGFLQQGIDFLVEQKRRGKLNQESFEGNLKLLWAEMEKDGLWAKVFQSIEQMASLELIGDVFQLRSMGYYRGRREEVRGNLAKISQIM